MIDRLEDELKSVDQASESWSLGKSESSESSSNKIQWSKWSTWWAWQLHWWAFIGQAPTLAQGFGSWAFPQSVDSLEMEAIQTFMLTPLSLSNLCAQYLWDHFQFKLNAYLSDSIGVATMPPFLPLMLLIPLTSELDCIALTLVDAFLNHRNYSGVVPSQDFEGFSAGEYIHLSDNQIKYNVFQREMMAATEKLFPLLGKHEGETEGPHGVITLSHAWFQQGHEVSADFAKLAALEWLDAICNCLMPLHWDGKTRRQWYHLLVTLGC
ncbi:hypothetical protein V8E53_004177 [Lactarius tabidus]